MISAGLNLDWRDSTGGRLTKSGATHQGPLAQAPQQGLADRIRVPLSLRRRLWQSLAATAFARGVQVGYVFVLVPILLLNWSLELYGEWIILVAAANFSALASLGLFQASAVEIALACSNDNRSRAAKILSTTSLVGVVGILAVVIAVGASARYID